jgi:hypothetical protein
MTTLFEAFASEHKDFPDTKTMSAEQETAMAKLFDLPPIQHEEP